MLRQKSIVFLNQFCNIFLLASLKKLHGKVNINIS